MGRAGYRGSREDGDEGSRRCVRGQEIDLLIRHPDAAVGPVEVLRVAAPAGSLPMKAENASKRCVLGREDVVIVSIQDLPVGARGDEAGPEPRGCVFA